MLNASEVLNNGSDGQDDQERETENKQTFETFMS